MDYTHKIYKELKGLQLQVAKWKAADEKIVFTNGVFDLLHLGHISYLAEAKALGDKLIVGVNSDASVKRLKGSERPLKDELTRAAIMASLIQVDAVMLFSEDTPRELIVSIMPDILVKGGDYKVKDIVGYAEVKQNGGEIYSLPFLEGHSSTHIIDKIKHSNG